MFERWNTLLGREICSPSVPQPFKVLCIRVRDSILPGAKRGASSSQPSVLLGKADGRLKGLRWPVHKASPEPAATLLFYLCLLETT